MIRQVHLFFLDQKFRDKVEHQYALLFVTPEHNRSIPAVFKNAIDVGFRPFGKSVWGPKPALIVSQSRSNLSGFGANHHFRQVLVVQNVYPIGQPEVYLTNVCDLVDEKGEIKKQSKIYFYNQW